MTVLVLRALGLGDFLTALPALRAVRRAHTDARVLLAAPAAIEPLAMLSATVDEVVDVEPLAPVPVPEPDIAINLHGCGPQSHRVLLATRPAKLVAYANPDVPETNGMPDWSAHEHEVDRWCRLVEGFGMAAERTELSLPSPRREPPGAAVGATLIHPGAASGARRWPPERWAAVARAEVAGGRAVAVSAGPSELDLARAVATMAGLDEGAVVAGDIIDLAAAVAAARIVVCGDTGVAHMATAFGTPSVVLFGPTAPERWGPPAWHPHVALWAGHEGDPHAATPDAGLLEICSAQVIAAVRMLGRRSLD